MPRDESYLLYMLLAARRVLRSTTGITLEAFRSDAEKVDSVILQIGNIGESANHVSKKFQREHPEIPWVEIISMRNRICMDTRRLTWRKCGRWLIFRFPR